MRYVLLLRGINVGGKNKVIVYNLKVDLAELGFDNPVHQQWRSLFWQSGERGED